MNHHLKHKRIFITATGTDVGKTVVSRALLQAFNKDGHNANAYKPLAIKHDETAQHCVDATILQSSSTQTFTSDEINPVCLDYQSIWQKSTPEFDTSLFSKGLNHIEVQSDVVVVEGTGGWRVLFDNDRYLSDWVKQEKLPVVLVVGIQQGCINHAILSAEAIRQDGLELIGWVANRINPGEGYYAENVETLSKQLAAPMLGELPYLYKPEQRDLSEYMNVAPLYETK